MQVLVNTPAAVVVSLSERNLNNLWERLALNGSASQMRLTEGGVVLTVIAEPDALHYAPRPDALAAYGLAPEPRVGAVSTPSSAASPEPWGEPMPLADACAGCAGCCEPCQ